MFWLRKIKEEIPFDWSCSKTKCEKIWKELMNIFVWEHNIHELERRLDNCNKCYLDGKANHPTVKLTRWNLSTEVHQYNSKKNRY